MGRGGRGGGGRSSGGGSRGGSRSSGGRRSSSSSSGRSSRSFGSSSRSSRSSSSWSSRSSSSYGGSSHRHIHFGGSSRGGGGCGLSLTPVIVIVVVIVMIFSFSIISSIMSSVFSIFTMFLPDREPNAGGYVSESTIEREPLPPEYVIETDWFTDELDWIASASTLESGMREFYKETGVQPYLYLVDSVNGSTYPSEDEMHTFANGLYDELFEDEGHLLLVFQEHNSDGNYYAYYVAGMQAKTVIDDEAADILLDYVDHYYYSDLDEDEMFAAVFRDTAERIMHKETSPLPIILIVLGVVAVAVIALVWWTRAKKQKNLEREQTARILNADLDTFSTKDPKLEELEKKYKDPK